MPAAVIICSNEVLTSLNVHVVISTAIATIFTPLESVFVLSSTEGSYTFHYCFDYMPRCVARVILISNDLQKQASLLQLHLRTKVSYVRTCIIFQGHTHVAKCTMNRRLTGNKSWRFISRNFGTKGFSKWRVSSL